MAYYQNPSSPKKLLGREIELCRGIKNTLGDNAKALYGDGYPFWVYYTMGTGDTSATAEFVRFLGEVKGLIRSDGATLHHCLSQLNEAQLRTPFREGVDLKDAGYDSCPQCRPTIQQIFYAMPDADVYIVVGRYPSSSEINALETAGAGLGFFPLYRNLGNILDSFAAGEETPVMKADYIFVTQSNFVTSLEKGADWPALTVPCLLLRYGTESFRENWLKIGWDAVFALQPLAERDQSVKDAFDRYLMELFSSRSPDEILREGIGSKNLPRHFKTFLQMRSLGDSFAIRHRLGKAGRIGEILLGDN